MSSTISIHPFQLYPCSLDSLHPTTNNDNSFNVGEYYSGGVKSFAFVAIDEFDLSPLAGWALSSVTLRGVVQGTLGSAFAATLRDLTEDFVHSQATWQNRITSTAWTTQGGTTTDTNKVQFTSPSADGEQDVVTGMLTLVQSKGTGHLRIHVTPDNRNPTPAVNTFFGLTSLWLVCTGTPPAAIGQVI